MRPRASDTRQRILDGAYRLFYESGFARAGMDAIAEAAGITKRSLYQHFDSKDSLLAAVMEQQHGLMLARIGQWIERDADSPRSMVEALFGHLSRWAASPGWRGSGFSRAALEFADLPGHPARRAARRHKRAVEDSLREALARRGCQAPALLARELMLLIEGCLNLALIHGERDYIAAAAQAALALTERHGMA